MSALTNMLDDKIKYMNQNSSQNKVTNISPLARVDYILRYAKQAVLVVAEQGEQYSAIASQLLSQHASNRNAAFLAVSPQSNDIQVRCRLFEQLFTNQLFDPEQSLAVSLVNCVKKQPQALTIVVEHNQHLSLQLTHELCQLAEIAKKAKLDIQVLMLGTYVAGANIASNKVLFDKKLAIVSAQSGQLLAITSTFFQTKSRFSLSPSARNYLIALLLLMFSAAATVGLLYQQDSLPFSGLGQPQPDKTVIQAESSEHSETLHPTNNNSSDVNDLAVKSGLTTIKPLLAEQANSEEILNAILLAEVGNNGLVSNNITVVISDAIESVETAADSQDVLVALAGNDADQTASEQINFENNQTADIKLAPYQAALGKSVYQPDYYLQNAQGVVIQYGAFVINDVAALQKFSRQYPELSHFAYIKTTNNSLMFVVTSGRYQGRADANQAITELPESLQAAGVWIKSIAAVQDEINRFQAGVETAQ